MHVSNLRRVSCIAALAFLAASAYAQGRGCLIEENGVGPVHAGMTIAQARRAMHAATLKPTQDADRLPLFGAIQEGLHTMDLYVDTAPPSDNSKITRIRVFDGACATREGVHPGMRLSDVAQKYGRVTRLITTDTESREFAQFERAPSWIDIQVGNGQEGIYPPGKRCTANYSPSAHIASLWVSHAGSSTIPQGDAACNAPRR